MAFMGWTEVLRNRKNIQANFRITREALLTEQPDTLILIDYPSFNLQIAAFCRKHLPETRIIYYIPPKVWAWKSWRVHRIARLCDEVLGIFPFEPAFYAKYGYCCTYVGNPTAEELSRVPRVPGSSKDLAILPGSRPAEITHCLPRMLEAARRFPDYTITVCAAPGMGDEYYRPYLRAGEQLTRDTYAAVQAAKAAIVNSGTATLETALLGCPQVAVYYVANSWFWGCIRWMQPLFFSIKHFTLVNIICDKQVIRELVANDFTVDKISAELERLLNDKDYTKEMLASYEHLRSLLGTEPAAVQAAQIITSKPR
jgi:lipid-A-disaccharide synthase